MVAVFSKSWLPSLRIPRLVSGTRAAAGSRKKLEILAFEAARTMSRLVSLHRSLSDDEISKLRSGVMRSEAIRHLNSPDQTFLLRLACAEMVHELDCAAAAVSRLAAWCSPSTGAWPKGFHHVYADLKAGTGSGGLDLRVLGFPAKDVNKRVRKMEAYAAAMGALHQEMEELAELEASEKKLQRWKSYSGPIPQQQSSTATSSYVPPPGAEILRKRLAWQSRVVRKMQEEALWGKSIDKAADLMARAVVTIFARICSVFREPVPELPRLLTDRNGRFHLFPVTTHHHQLHYKVFPDHFSGPLERPGPAYQLPDRHAIITNSGPLRFPHPSLLTTQEPPADDKPTATADPDNSNKQAWMDRVLVQPPSTVGGAGLALRYADVIALAERMLYSPEMVGEETKNQLYQMLPRELRTAVTAQIRGICKNNAAAARRGVPVDERAEAGRLREDARKVLAWLAPMAHDTIRWHTDRSYEQQKLEAAPKLLVLQTLCWSDRNKTEEAITNVLVALSFVFRYLHRTAAADQEDDWV